MGKKYICTGYGVDKNTGSQYWTVAPIFEGVTKDDRPFGMIQIDQRMSVDEELAIGEVKEFALTSL